MNKKKRREAYRMECESNGGDCYFCKYWNECPKSDFNPKEDEDREYMETPVGNGGDL